MGSTVRIGVTILICLVAGAEADDAPQGAPVPMAEPLQMPATQEVKTPAPAIPVVSKMAEMLTWKEPHGGYMLRLRQRIIDADRRGDIELRDRLLAIYEAWAAKYLDPRSSDTK
jgi:hypothetical protein